MEHRFEDFDSKCYMLYLYWTKIWNVLNIFVRSLPHSKFIESNSYTLYIFGSNYATVVKIFFEKLSDSKYFDLYCDMLWGFWFEIWGVNFCFKIFRIGTLLICRIRRWHFVIILIPFPTRETLIQNLDRCKFLIRNLICCKILVEFLILLKTFGIRSKVVLSNSFEILTHFKDFFQIPTRCKA